MIRTLLCTDASCTRQQVDRAEIGHVLADQHNLLWLDLENPTPEELRLLAGEFGIHPLALEDATKQHQRPKIDRYDTFYFIVFYDIDYYWRGVGWSPRITASHNRCSKGGKGTECSVVVWGEATDTSRLERADDAALAPNCP